MSDIVSAIPSSKIVLIGAASASFGPSMLADLIAHKDTLRGCEVWLVDTDAGTLETMLRYAKRLNELAGTPFVLRASPDRRAALPGAHFVITSIAVDRIATWKLDWQIPLKHGVRHVLGENGGPGGLSHALRNIPILLGIARDIEELAPDALVLNFTNPMTRLCMALTRHTKLKVVGLCHQIGEGYRLVNQVLQLVPVSNAHSYAYQQALEARYHLTAAGLNHFTFITDLRDKLTGADLYPQLRSALAKMPADFELMSRRLMDAFGLYCATGDGHAGEYVGFAADTIPLSGYDYDEYQARSATQWDRIKNLSALNDLSGISPSGERAIPIINAIRRDLIQPELSVNIVNNGCISNLPDSAVVELPGLVDARGVHGVHVGELPRGLASMLRTQIDIMELVVQAGVFGDRNAALQALLLDPVVHSYAQAEHMLDELLKTHAKYLPQFA